MCKNSKRGCLCNGHKTSTDNVADHVNQDLLEELRYILMGCPGGILPQLSWHEIGITGAAINHARVVMARAVLTLSPADL